MSRLITASFNPLPSRRTADTSPASKSCAFITCFNPLPSRRTADTSSPRICSCFALFQSTAVPKDGRYYSWLCPRRDFIVFQSTAVPKDGRYCKIMIIFSNPKGFNPLPSRRTADTVHLVSARPRDAGFNPLPSRRTADTNCPRRGCEQIRVSIHCRPEGRQIRLPMRASWLIASFNPLPSRRTADTSCELDFPSMIVCFNPLPSRRTADTWPCVSQNATYGFNPLPSRRTADTLCAKASEKNHFDGIKAQTYS